MIRGGRLALRLGRARERLGTDLAADLARQTPDCRSVRPFVGLESDQALRRQPLMQRGEILLILRHAPAPLLER